MKGMINLSEFIVVVPFIGEILLTTSDIIELIGIVASLLMSAVAIAISLVTLRQNSKMIEESTRPQLQIYPVYMDTLLYLIIKNYGSSEAYIDQITCSHVFTRNETFGDDLGEHIFDKLSGAILASGHSIKCPLIGYEVKNETFDFQVKYHSANKKYIASFSFNPISNLPFSDTYPLGNSTNGHLQNITKELHNIVKSNL